ncbi:MAG: DUF3429 domain-containing protein [Polaromonas sp.]|nr:DUF3429 domain-containing protein [Polaromonas sp.]
MPQHPPSLTAQALVHRLGYAGLVPFVGLTLLMWLVDADALPYVALLMVAYAALIAAFLGGIHWGLVWVLVSGGGTAPALADGALQRHLVWGVVPSLLAWPGVLMPAYAALPWLGVLLLVCYGVDRRLFPAAGLSAWLTLRFRLSAVAALSCFVAAGAV